MQFVIKVIKAGSISVINVIRAALSVVVALVGGSSLILILLTLMFLDFLTGIAYARINHQITSQKFINCGLRKVGILIAIFVISLLTIATMNFYEIEMIANSLNFIEMLPKITMGYFILGESISILENLDKLGVKTPKFISLISGKLKNNIDNFSK